MCSGTVLQLMVYKQKMFYVHSVAPVGISETESLPNTN